MLLNVYVEQLRWSLAFGHWFRFSHACFSFKHQRRKTTSHHITKRTMKSDSCVRRVPTVLENSLTWYFWFSLKTPWKVLEFRWPSLKFQLVVLESLILCILNWKFEWIQRIKGYKSQFFKKFRLASLAAAYKLIIFSNSSCSYMYILVILEQLLSYPSFPKNAYRYLCIFCVSNVLISLKMDSLYSYCDIITKLVYPPELSRIAGFCTNSINFFLREDPQTALSISCFRLYYNHDKANHLKKNTKHIPNPTPNPYFSGKLNIKWLSLYVLFEQPIVDNFFVNGCLKE